MPKPKYPHMRQWEQEIMEKFHNAKILNAEWSYDVPLRVRLQPLPEYITDAEATLWSRLTSKRIDAVAETPGEIYVIEIKDRLRPSAVGQALTYKTLYEEQFAPHKPVTATIVTEIGDLDMQHVCDAYNIKVFEV